MMTSCSTSPLPLPIKPKPVMVDTQMQTEGDPTWDNSKSWLDDDSDQMDSSQTQVSDKPQVASCECQTEAPSPVKLSTTSWDPSTGQTNEEDGLIVRYPLERISEDIKFLNGEIASDFVDITELPKLQPINPQVYLKMLENKCGGPEAFKRMRIDVSSPPPMRPLFNHKGLPKLRPINDLIKECASNTIYNNEIKYDDMPKLRPLKPLLLVGNTV